MSNIAVSGVPSATSLGVRRLMSAVLLALRAKGDPWQRLGAVIRIVAQVA